MVPDTTAALHTKINERDPLRDSCSSFCCPPEIDGQLNLDRFRCKANVLTFAFPFGSTDFCPQLRDRIMAAPSDEDQLNPAYDSGDHLHPNDAGYRTMANAINPADLG